MNPGGGIAIAGIGSAVADLVTDFWLTVVGIAEATLNSLRTIAASFISNPVAAIFLLLAFLFVIPWVPYHHMGLAYAQTAYSCVVQPLVDNLLLPVARGFAPIYETVAKVWNAALFVPVRLRNDFLLTILRCKATTEIVRVGIRSVLPLARATTVLVTMAGDAIVGRSSDYSAAQQAVGLSFSAAANVTDAASDILACFCAPGAYWFDAAVIVLRDDSVRCTASTTIAIVQEFFASWFRSLYRAVEWFVRVLGWVVCRAFSNAMHTDADCGEFPPFYASEILPEGERLFELMEASICCVADLADDVGNTAVIAALDLGNLTWWLPNVDGAIGPHFTVPTDAKYGTPIRMLMPLLETVRLAWSTFGRVADTVLTGQEPDFSGLETGRIYDAAASTCVAIADGAESFGQLERFAAVAFTAAEMPAVGLPMPWIPFVYGPRAINHSCLAIVELGRALAGVLTDVRTYDDYKTGHHFDCMLRELRSAVEHAANDSAELFSLVPAWRTCEWVVADEGEFPVPFYPTGLRPPVLRCEESVYGREMGLMLSAPADIAVAAIEYAVAVTEHFDTFDDARRVSTDCIFDACVRDVRAMGVVFADTIDQIPGSLADAQTLVGVTQSGVDALVEFLPFSEESEQQLHDLTEETLGKMIEFLETIPYATADVFLPDINETRNVNLVDLIPVVFPVRSIPPVVTEASVTLVEIMRFVAATIHTGDFENWEFDPAVLERLIAQQAVLANVAARAIVQPMCLAREILESEGCADWMWLNSTAFNVSTCLPKLLPCPEDAIAAFFRSNALTLDAIAELILHPDDFSETLFERPLCELETSAYELGRAFESWNFHATIPYWDAEIDVDGAVLMASSGYAIAKLLGLTNKIAVEAIKATMGSGYGYEWAPGCTETSPSRLNSTTCVACTAQPDSENRCPDGTTCCVHNGKCGDRCFDGEGLKDYAYEAAGALASLADALAGASGFVDPRWAVVVGEGGMIVPSTLKAIFDLAFLPTIDPDATYAAGASELLCAVSDFSRAASNFVALPVAVGGHVASALFDAVDADATSDKLRGTTGYLAEQTARMIDAYGQVAIEVTRTAFATVGAMVDLGAEQKPFLEFLEDAVDNVCRVEEALERLPNATGEFVRALDVTGNNLTCELGGAVGSVVDLVTATTIELLGIVGSVTEAPHVKRGINISKIIEKTGIVVAESASFASGLAYDLFSLVVQDEDSRKTMMEVFDDVGFFAYAIANVFISILTSAANAFAILLSAFDDVSPVFDAFCGLSTEPFDVISPVLKAITTLMEAFANLIRYVSEPIADFFLAVANMIEMFFENENSAIYKFVTAFFDMAFALVDVLLSFFSGGSVSVEMLKFLQALFEFVDTIATIALDTIVGIIDEFIFGGIEIAGRGVVECILELGDCVKDLVGGLFGLAPRATVGEYYSSAMAPASSTMILAMAYMFPEGDSCVSTFVSVAALRLDYETRLAACVAAANSSSEEDDDCASIVKVELPGYRLTWRASLCLDRFVRRGYGEPYGLYFDVESGTMEARTTRATSSSSSSSSDNEATTGECTGDAYDDVCFFDEIDAIVSKIETTMSTLLTAALDPDGVIAGAEKLANATNETASIVDLEFLATLVSQSASGLSDAGASLVRRAIVLSYFDGDETDNSTADRVDAIMGELGGYLESLSAAIDTLAATRETRSARGDDAVDLATEYPSVRYVLETYGRGSERTGRTSPSDNGVTASPSTISVARLDGGSEDYRQDECGHYIADMAGFWGESGRFDAPCPAMCPTCEEPEAQFEMPSLCPIDACPEVLADYPELRAACARVCDSAVKTDMFKSLCVDTLTDLSDGDLDDIQEVWEVKGALSLYVAGYYMLVDVGEDDPETWTVSSADLKKILDVDGDDGPLKPADVCTDVGRYGHPSSEFCSSRCDANLESSLVYRVFRGGQPNLLSDYGRIFLTYVCEDFCSYYDPDCKAPKKILSCPPSLTSSLTCLHTCDVVYEEDTFSSDEPVVVPETCRTATLECTPLSPGLDAIYDSSCRCPPDWYEPTINASEVCMCTYDLSGTSSSYATTPYNVMPFICPNTARRGVYHYFDDLDYQALSAAMRVKISNPQYVGSVSLVVADADDAEELTTKVEEEYPGGDDYPPLITLPSDPIDPPTVDDVSCWSTTEAVVHQACGSSFECATSPPVYCTEEIVCESWTDYTVLIIDVDEHVTETRTLYPTWHYPIWQAAGNQSAAECFDSGSIGRCNDTICLPGSTYVDPLGASCDPELHCARGTFCPASETCDAWAIGAFVGEYTADFDFYRENDVVAASPSVTTKCYVKRNCTYGGNWCVESEVAGTSDVEAPSECPTDSTPVSPEQYLTGGLRTYRLYGYDYKCFNESESCHGTTVGCLLNMTIDECEDVVLCQRIRACPSVSGLCFNATWCPICEYCDEYDACDECADACSETDVCAVVTICPTVPATLEAHLLCERNTTAGCRNVSACSDTSVVFNDTAHCNVTQKAPLGFAGVVPLFSATTPYPWTFFKSGAAACDIPWVDTGHFCSYLCDDGTGLDASCYDLIADGIDCGWYLNETNVPSATSYGPAMARKWLCQALGSEVATIDAATFPIVGMGKIYPDQVYMIATAIKDMKAYACPSRTGEWTNVTTTSLTSPSEMSHDACIMLAPTAEDDEDVSFAGVVEQLSTEECAKIRRYVENTYLPDYAAASEKYMSGAAECPPPAYFDARRYRDRPMVGCEIASASPDLPFNFAWDTSPYLDRVSVGGFVGNDDPESPYYVRDAPLDERQRRRTSTSSSSTSSRVWLVNEIKEMLEDGRLSWNDEEVGTRRILASRYGTGTTRSTEADRLVDEAYEIYRAFKSVGIPRFLGGCQDRGVCPEGPDCTVEREIAKPCTDWPYNATPWTACEPRTYECRYGWKRPCETWLVDYLVVLTEEELGELLYAFSGRSLSSSSRSVPSPFDSMMTTIESTKNAITTRIADSGGARTTVAFGLAARELYAAIAGRLDIAACASMPWSRACGRVSRWKEEEYDAERVATFESLKSTRATRMVDAVRASLVAKDSLLPPLSATTMECYLMCGYDWDDLLERSCVWQATSRDGAFGNIFDAIDGTRAAVCDAMDVGNGSSLFIADLSDYIPDLTLIPFREPVIGTTGWSDYINITHTTSFSPYSTSTELGRVLYQLETIAANVFGCIFGVDVGDLDAQSSLLAFGASLFGFDNATEFKREVGEWLSNFNLDVDDGEVGALYWGLLLSPFGANCASVNGTHKWFGSRVPVYSPLWWSTVVPLPYLPTWAGNATVSVLEWIGDREFIVPNSMVIDPSGCANVTNLCVPLSRSCDCYPSFENCGERLGFVTVQDYVFMLLNVLWPDAPNATLPRLLAAFTGTSSYLTKYADVRSWSDFWDRAYCLGVVGIPWMLWWVVVGSFAVYGAYFLLRLLIALAKFLFMVLLSLFLLIVMAGSYGPTVVYRYYDGGAITNEYWDETAERWLPLRVRPRGSTTDAASRPRR